MQMFKWYAGVVLYWLQCHIGYILLFSGVVVLAGCLVTAVVINTQLVQLVALTALIVTIVGACITWENQQKIKECECKKWNKKN